MHRNALEFLNRLITFWDGFLCPSITILKYLHEGDSRTITAHLYRFGNHYGINFGKCGIDM